MHFDGPTIELAGPLLVPRVSIACSPVSSTSSQQRVAPMISASRVSSVYDVA